MLYSPQKLDQLLARQSADFGHALAAELARDPDSMHQRFAAQIEHLLHKPSLSLQDSPLPIVFVIDALDCGNTVTCRTAAKATTLFPTCSKRS